MSAPPPRPWRVALSDVGLATEVSYDGVVLQGVTGVTVRSDKKRGATRVTIEVEGLDCDITHNHGPALVEVAA